MPDVARLNRLITVLENVPEERFDLRSWSCGTAACACGWAAVDPVLRAQGFRLRLIEGRQRQQVPDLDKNEPLNPNKIELFYKHRTSFLAAAAFFGITEDEAERLFAPYSGHYHTSTPTPEEVVVAIKRVIKSVYGIKLTGEPKIAHLSEEEQRILGAQLMRELLGGDLPTDRPVQAKTPLIEVVMTSSGAASVASRR